MLLFALQDTFQKWNWGKFLCINSKLNGIEKKETIETIVSGKCFSACTVKCLLADLAQLPFGTAKVTHHSFQHFVSSEIDMLIWQWKWSILSAWDGPP